jgi:hypothetical protein
MPSSVKAKNFRPVMLVVVWLRVKTVSVKGVRPQPQRPDDITIPVENFV